MSNIVNIPLKTYDAKSQQELLKKIVNRNNIKDIIELTFDFSNKYFSIVYTQDDGNGKYKYSNSYNEFKKLIYNIDDYIYSNESIIVDEKDFYSFDTLKNKNIVVIKYKHHHKNSLGEEKPIMSLKPGRFYIAEKTNDKYKLLTINKFDRSSSGYIHVTKDHRMEEYPIDVWSICGSCMKPHMFDNTTGKEVDFNLKNETNIGILFNQFELNDKNHILNTLNYKYNNSFVTSMLEGKQYLSKNANTLNALQEIGRNVKFYDMPMHADKRAHYIDIDIEIPDWYKVMKQYDWTKLSDQLLDIRKRDKIIKNSLYGEFGKNLCGEIPLPYSGTVAFDLIKPTKMSDFDPDLFRKLYLDWTFEYDKHADIDGDRFLLDHRIPRKKHIVDLSLGMDEEFLHLL